MLQRKFLLIEVLATLCDYSLSFTVAVHLMTGKTMVAGKQVVVKSDTEQGNRPSTDVYDLEAKVWDEAA